MPTPSDVLAKVPLFALLDGAELEALAARVEEIEAAAGTMLFQIGDPGDALYVLLDGQVEIFVKNAAGERFLFERAEAGDFFGEISLLDGGPRTASALVTKKLSALLLSREDLERFLVGCPSAALDLIAAMGRRLRENARLIRDSAPRNINLVTEDRRNRVQRAADWISDFSGSLSFLFIHVGLFAVWIGLNVPPLDRSGAGGFDPFPFGLLTMAVSLEAIILSVFVLLSQNRQASRDRVRNDIEYEVNLCAEREVKELHEKLDHFYEEVIRRLALLERSTSSLRPK